MSSTDLALSILGPLLCVCVGGSSKSPVYFGWGRCFARDVAVEVIVIGQLLR